MNDRDIKIAAYLAVIIDIEKRLITHGEAAYGPERDFNKKFLEECKQKYYALLAES